MSTLETIRITPDALFQQPLSPLIYGEFIELLNDLIPGMWAEKVQDRSFAGVLQPQQVYPPGQNWVYPRWRTSVAATPRFGHWMERPGELEMLQASAAMELDASRAFFGMASARITVHGPEVGGYVAGIAQDDIAVRQGQTLNVELYLCGAGDAGEVTVSIGRNYGVFLRAYDQFVISGVTGEWQRFAGSLVSDTTDEHASLAIGISRPGTFWLNKVSMMPEDDVSGWRPDVVQAVRDLKPGIIRFGGSSLIYYDWRIGVGPRERRRPFENRPWGNMEQNDVGLHEFLQFCELVDAEPLICLNSNSATIQQILDEIEYCNGLADSPWGSVRAAMGHPEPFNVKYWQIGNEQSGKEYEQRMVDYAHTIRAHHPQLTLLASYPSDNILLNLSDEIDYVCPHIYDPYSKVVEEGLEALIDKIRSRAKNKDLRIAITEWNHTGGHWGWARAWLLTHYNALNAARMFNLYQRHGDMIHIANRSNMTNSCNSGILQTSPADIYFTPTYYVQQAYANYAGDCALRVVSSSADGLDVAATRRGATGEIAVFAVNYGGQPQRRQLDLGLAIPNRTHVAIWTLTAQSPDAVNSLREKTRVAPQESTLDISGTSTTYEFPPFSVTVLRL